MGRANRGKKGGSGLRAASTGSTDYTPEQIAFGKAGAERKARLEAAGLYGPEFVGVEASEEAAREWLDNNPDKLAAEFPTNVQYGARYPNTAAPRPKPSAKQGDSGDSGDSKQEVPPYAFRGGDGNSVLDSLGISESQARKMLPESLQDGSKTIPALESLGISESQARKMLLESLRDGSKTIPALESLGISESQAREMLLESLREGSQKSIPALESLGISESQAREMFEDKKQSSEFSAEDYQETFGRPTPPSSGNGRRPSPDDYKPASSKDKKDKSSLDSGFHVELSPEEEERIRNLDPGFSTEVSPEEEERIRNMDPGFMIDESDPRDEFVQNGRPSEEDLQRWNTSGSAEDKKILADSQGGNLGESNMHAEPLPLGPEEPLPDPEPLPLRPKDKNSGEPVQYDLNQRLPYTEPKEKELKYDLNQRLPHTEPKDKEVKFDLNQRLPHTEPKE